MRMADKARSDLSPSLPQPLRPSPMINEKTGRVVSLEVPSESRFLSLLSKASRAVFNRRRQRGL
jgi:hypothetical protein